jgi:hypothetical protein
MALRCAYYIEYLQQGGSLLKEVRRSMEDDLWKTWGEKWALGKKRALANDDGYLWVMGPSIRGGQAMLWHDTRTRIRHINVIPFGEEVFTYDCWIDEEGKQGLTDNDNPYECPLPDDAVNLLKSALPLPRAGSLYGFVKGDKVTTIYMPWRDRHGDDQRLHITYFILQGAKAPGIVDTGLRPAKWWEAVDAGALVLLDEKIKHSREPIEMRRHEGAYQYILVRSEEVWTGVKGSALYVRYDAQPIQIDQALRLHGSDARSVF